VSKDRRTMKYVGEASMKKPCGLSGKQEREEPKGTNGPAGHQAVSGSGMLTSAGSLPDCWPKEKERARM